MKEGAGGGYEEGVRKKSNRLAKGGAVRRDEEVGIRKKGAQEKVKRKGPEGEGKREKRGAGEGRKRGTEVWAQDG